jgi:LCP family protein required for cell wall assembly
MQPPNNYPPPAYPGPGPGGPPMMMYPPPRRPIQRRNSLGRNFLTGCCLGNVLSLLLGLLFAGGGLGFYAVNPPDTMNILILGTDERPGTGESEIARTDSIMVLSVNPQNHSVSLLSLPRDVFIDSPNYGNLRANTIVRNAELTSAGTGISEMVASMEYTFGMDIHHYVRLSFDAFVDVVDALGGVNIDVPKKIVDYEYPTPDYGTIVIEFEPGEQHMDGERALIYARTRHADDDYQRAARQQQVIGALMGKIANPLNLPRWPVAWAAFYQNVDTDMNFDEWMTIAPGMLLYGYNGDQIDRLVVDREYVYGGVNGVVPDTEKIRPWINEHMQ